MANESLGKCNTTNRTVLAWVEEQTKLCQPDQVFWCDGSEAEKELLTAEAVAQGILIKLNQEKLPGCYYHRSNPNDVARVEQCTFICTETPKKPARPTTGPRPAEMYAKAPRLVPGRDARPHDVRRPLSDGAARFAADQGRHRIDRFHLRRAEHAHHDAHGQGRLSTTRRERRISIAACIACSM